MELKVVFVSNYINHHQIPFCNAMYRQLGGDFLFIQTEPMEQERVRMGWQEESLPYVRYFYEQEEECKRWILESRVVLFGGTDEEGYIVPRLEAGKPVVRYHERLYKTGQWKAVSPRGLLRKYQDHTKYRRDQVYMLCAGAYVPSDFHLVRAYPGKMYRWGYFPETKHYDVDELLANKGFCVPGKAGSEERIPYLLWAARFIDWKHPELPVRMAAALKKKGIRFHMDIIGGGELEEEVIRLVRELDVGDSVSLPGFKRPGEVRACMEKADIYLVTSDRQEGWGAVVNEAMNSGCAVVASHMIGAVPYLIEPEKNGRIYRDGEEGMLLALLEELCLQPELCRRLGRNAYRTIVEEWNPETASERLLGLMGQLGLLSVEAFVKHGHSAGQEFSAKHGQSVRHKPVGQSGCYITGPCSPAPVIGERKMARLLEQAARSNRQQEEMTKKDM